MNPQTGGRTRVWERPVGSEGAEHANLSKKLSRLGMQLLKPGEGEERAWRCTFLSGILTVKENQELRQELKQSFTYTHIQTDI